MQVQDWYTEHLKNISANKLNLQIKLSTCSSMQSFLLSDTKTACHNPRTVLAIIIESNLHYFKLSFILYNHLNPGSAETLGFFTIIYFINCTLFFSHSFHLPILPYVTYLNSSSTWISIVGIKRTKRIQKYLWLLSNIFNQHCNLLSGTFTDVCHGSKKRSQLAGRVVGTVLLHPFFKCPFR